MQGPVVQTASELDDLLHRFLRRYVRVNTQSCDAFTDAFARLIKFTECPREVREVTGQLGILLKADMAAEAGKACWQRANGNYLIRYSQYANIQVATFGIIHEVFEIMAAHPDFPTRLTQYQEERLANRFAAQFLMPAKEVRAAATYYLDPGLRRYLVPKLADRFRVSRPAMKIRLCDLGILQRTICQYNSS